MKIHPVAELFPMLSQNELQGLAEDIKENGLQQPIVIQGDVLLDGRNRLEACKIVGVEPEFKEFGGENVFEFIIGANLHRRHLNESQRAMIAARLANMRSGARTDRPNPNLDEVSLGRAAGLLNVGRSSVADAKFIDRESPELASKVKNGEITIHAAKEELRPHVSFNSGNDEWYTPKEYIDLARIVLGEIDLDPASNIDANAVINAKEFYDINHNGLTKKWSGRVWMNPPYLSGVIEKFIDKFVSSFQSGEIVKAIVLVNNATETKWFNNLASIASAICFPMGRIKYWHPQKPNMLAPLQGQALLYFGREVKLFIEKMNQIGVVWVKPNTL